MLQYGPCGTLEQRIRRGLKEMTELGGEGKWERSDSVLQTADVILEQVTGFRFGGSYVANSGNSFEQLSLTASQAKRSKRTQWSPKGKNESGGWVYLS